MLLLMLERITDMRLGTEGMVDSLKLVLLKDGRQVLSKKIKVRETVQTPWMGMRITVSSIVPGGVTQEEVRPTELQPKMPLPPSAPPIVRQIERKKLQLLRDCRVDMAS